MLCVDYSDTGYLVKWNNELVGQSIESFISAHSFAKEYANQYQVEISISDKAIEMIEIKKEFEVLAEKLELPKTIFHGLAERIEMYKAENHQKKSFDSFMEWLKKANQIAAMIN